MKSGYSGHRSQLYHRRYLEVLMIDHQSASRGIVESLVFQPRLPHSLSSQFNLAARRHL